MKRIVRTDEILIRLSPDFNEATGEYKETLYTKDNDRQASCLPMMAKMLLCKAERDPG